MTEMNATILIPDISGFTEFMTNTELSHSSHAINILIESILKAVENEYEVSEIEGDAVLLIKKGPAPSQKEISDTCLKIFNSFHFQRKWMQQYTICPCGACQAIINLTLKFVVHHGTVAESKVGKFITQSGTEMIVAHRLLKNSIPAHEYVLMTEKFIRESGDRATGLEWESLSDEYASIGKIDYQFARLTEARNKIPEPPVPETHYLTDNSSYLEIPIYANYFDTYMVVMDIVNRAKWLPQLLKVEQDVPYAFITSVHHCFFEEYESIVSPVRMTASGEGIMYAESCNIPERNISVVHELIFRKTNDTTCSFACRFLNNSTQPLTEENRGFVFEKMKQMSESLKKFSEAKQ